MQKGQVTLLVCTQNDSLQDILLYTDGG